MTGLSTGQVIVEVAWEDGSVPRNETFDFGQAASDGSHLGAVRDFFAEFQEATGCTIKRAVISLVQDPAGWLSAERERRGKPSE